MQQKSQATSIVLQFIALVDRQFPYTTRPSMNVIDRKWIFRVKYNSDGTIQRYKARLVAKGFQQYAGVEFTDTFNPVIKASTIRVIFTLVVTYNWEIRQIDFNNAFLNGEIAEIVYLSQPAGFVSTSHPQHVCKLQKALYGLKQAPRAWFHKLKEALRTWGFISSTSDTSLYKHNDNFLLLLVYVDDLLITGNNAPLIQTLIQDLQNRFALKDLGLVKDFLGFEALRTTIGLHLTQSKYTTDLLIKTKMHSAKPVPTPMSATLKLHVASGPAFSDPTLYRSTIGALQYLTYTRPDIAFAINKLSQYLQKPTELHWTTCKRILRYLKGTVHRGLHFTSASSLHLQVYTDADWASSIDDRRSITGYCVFLGTNLLTWSSRKQSVVVRSSTKAEYRALAHASTEVAWLRSLFSELGISLINTPVIWCDNQGVGALAANPVFHSRTKHIEVDVHYVHEQVLDQKLVVSCVPSTEQVADLFTKPLSIPRFQYLLTKLNLAVSPGCA
ncbi:hypothetical protein VitviT2T_014123 [Vitis vinifera]|uniref:Reverse transcriptase Ty1/copia-type domain-containing protein n=1 Tax=Vitis vinifera TaxID=29760 RepID=A0ABY9CL75_VITVI|nr:hypothetical protein VitviT2T_014123 [Vitis vinifera]